ncbi:MAG TPA: hypothetical protein PK156_29750 [Polyangium sp.]|nr:hypothetical protein [Polyangium sp.]
MTKIYGSTPDQVTEKRPDLAFTRSFLFVVLHGDQPALGGTRYHLSDLDVVDIGRGTERVGSRIGFSGAVPLIHLRRFSDPLRRVVTGAFDPT